MGTRQQTLQQTETWRYGRLSDVVSGGAVDRENKCQQACKIPLVGSSVGLMVRWQVAEKECGRMVAFGCFSFSLSDFLIHTQWHGRSGISACPYCVGLHVSSERLVLTATMYRHVGMYGVQRDVWRRKRRGAEGRDQKNKMKKALEKTKGKAEWGEWQQSTTLTADYRVGQEWHKAGRWWGLRPVFFLSSFLHSFSPSYVTEAAATFISILSEFSGLNFLTA